MPDPQCPPALPESLRRLVLRPSLRPCRQPREPVSLRTECELTAHMMASRMNEEIAAAKGVGMSGGNSKLSQVDARAMVLSQ